MFKLIRDVREIKFKLKAIEKKLDIIIAYLHVRDKQDRSILRKMEK
jgi:hypothetical protein